jgi:23S rRNA pseudouridine1911/1915/1917 synthase
MSFSLGNTNSQFEIRNSQFPMTLTFKIDEENVDSRLDAFLASQITNWSRARLQRLIENEDVLVNGSSTKASYRLRKNDEVEVELNTPESDSFTPQDIPLNIVYEDDVLIIVNKPAGLVVHPAAGIHTGTLANALAFHFQHLPSSGPIRPGIVHRLDRDTSGLLVAAKTEQALEHLSDQFRDRTVLKSYVALVHGRIEAEAGRIDQPVARDPGNRTRMGVVLRGRSALSLYKVRRRYQRFTLLDVELKTGRTHQIRVHLAWLRHPVVGDETYGGGRDNTIQNAKVRARIRNLGRHFLHAERLGLNHPQTGARLEFNAPLPGELTTLLEELELEEKK